MWGVLLLCGRNQKQQWQVVEERKWKGSMYYFCNAEVTEEWMRMRNPIAQSKAPWENSNDSPWCPAAPLSYTRRKLFRYLYPSLAWSVLFSNRIPTTHGWPPSLAKHRSMINRKILQQLISEMVLLPYIPQSNNFVSVQHEFTRYFHKTITKP